MRLFAVAPIVSIAAAITYVATETVMPVIVLFWAGATATVASIFFVRRSPKLCAASVAVSVASLYVAARSAWVWTVWSIWGFAP